MMPPDKGNELFWRYAPNFIKNFVLNEDSKSYFEQTVRAMLYRLDSSEKENKIELKSFEEAEKYLSDVFNHTRIYYGRKYQSFDVAKRFFEVLTDVFCENRIDNIFVIMAAINIAVASLKLVQLIIDMEFGNAEKPYDAYFDNENFNHRFSYFFKEFYTKFRRL